MSDKRIISLYEENAAAWDRLRGRDLHEHSWLERFASALPVNGSVLDVGCGAGEPLARWFIERGYAVTGVDSSPTLIAACRTRFPDREWIVADMRMLDLGRRFDGILAWHSFFHLSPDDQRPMFARFAAHAKPGGALMFTSGPEHGELLGMWQGEPLYHGSLAPAEYQALLHANAFEVTANAIVDPDCGHSTIWLAQMRPASGLDGSA